MLPAPSFTGLLTEWTVQPVAIAAAVVLGGWYARAAHRRPDWPLRRSLLFAVGLLALVWTTCGFAGAYLDSLFWVWTAQQLTLLLVVPYLLMAALPLSLAPRFGPRLLNSRVVRVLGNPLIGPAAVPLLSAVLFFGPLPRWAIATPAFGWIEPLVLVAIGALIVLPLTGAGGARTSLAVGLSLAIGSFELVLDAVPGIALRLHRTVSTSYFDLRASHPWTPAPVHDQQTAGSVLWCVSELLDLPFLVLVFVQWLRADARDAAQIDAVLDAESIARGESVAQRDPADPAATPEQGPRDQPWWLTDPAMQRRLQHRE